MACPAAASAGVTVSHLYQLADFSGTLPYNEARLTADRQHGELYAADGDVVRIFNESGMEIFEFSRVPEIGSVIDVAVDESGDVLLLSLAPVENATGLRVLLTRCNYRGEPKGEIRISGVPSEFSGFVPNAMLYRGGRLVLVSRLQMQVVITDPAGAFQKGYDLGKLAGVDDKDRADSFLGGFDMDAAGDMLFTVPLLFRAFVVSPSGEVRSFGKVGSAPGMFGIVAGIAASDAGDIYVADKLRSVVMVFDKELQLLTEFGGYGGRPENLTRPCDLVVGNAGKLYVTQMRSRGISVFSIASSE